MYIATAITEATLLLLLFFYELLIGPQPTFPECIVIFL